MSLLGKAKTGLLTNTSTQISLGEIFNDRVHPEITEEKFYIAYFNEVPNCIEINDINCEKANKWFEEFYRNDVNDAYINKLYFDKRGATSYPPLNIYYILYEGLLVYFNIAYHCLKLLLENAGRKN